MSETAKKSNFGTSALILGVVLLVIGGGLTAMGMGGGLKGLSGPYIFGAMFWACLTFGCLGLNLLFQATRARWGTPLVRIFEAGGGLLHLVLTFITLFVIGFMVFKDHIYGAWLHMPATDQILQNKKFYLNETAFMIRSVIYFVILGGIAYAFRKWTLKEVETGSKKWSDLRNNASGISMVAYFVVLTFLTTDYVMSIDPHWYSTIWGVLFAVGGGLSAMSLAVAIVLTQQNKEPYVGKIDNLMKNDFGNLTLMLTMLWGYFSFSQLLIIWYGNLPEFIPFYLTRLTGNFSALGGMLFFLQFLLPFLALLSPSFKRGKGSMLMIMGIVFVMRIADMYWIIMPFFKEMVTPALTDFGPLLAIGGVWLLGFSWVLKQAPLYVVAHPSEAAQEHSNGLQDLKEATENV